MERYKVGDKVLVEGRGTARPRTVIEITKSWERKSRRRKRAV